MSINGLSFLHLELTSRCNKSCCMCGRRKLEKEYPELCDWGDMPYEMVEEISKQVPSGIVVQFHNNGEPLLYPDLGRVLRVFKFNIRCFNTNGKLLLDKADEIIGNLETLTISVVQDDPEQEEQYETICRFNDKRNSRKPYVVYRLLGEIKNAGRWESLSGIVARRILHSPRGSFGYTKLRGMEKAPPTVPEIGICLDLLTHLAINRFGEVSVCVRFDPKKEGVIGNLKSKSLEEIWNGEVRKYYLDCHINGHRKYLKLCSKCDYWGIPRGE